MDTYYQFADTARVSGINAQVAGERLAELKVEHDVLTPKLIVDDARPVDAVLHPVFEWDDAAAAELHREWQARNLVKSIRVVESDDEQQVPRRAFLNVIIGDQRGYVTCAHVMSDDVLREQVLLKAKADLKAWRIRYAELKELAELFGVIDEITSGSVPASEVLVAKGQ